MKPSTQALINVLKSEQDKCRKAAAQAQANFETTGGALHKRVVESMRATADRHQNRINALVQGSKMAKDFMSPPNTTN